MGQFKIIMLSLNKEDQNLRDFKTRLCGKYRLYLQKSIKNYNIDLTYSGNTIILVWTSFGWCCAGGNSTIQF
jgi:hypothetical protein